MGAKEESGVERVWYRYLPWCEVTDVGEIILGKKNPGINYLLHIESNESKKNMVLVPENSKTIYIASKTHDSIKTLRNDYNRLLQHRFSYLQPIWSLTCPYRIQESIQCFGMQFQQF